MRNALDIFYIMLMLILPSSEPSGALVKKSEFGTSVSEPAVVRVSYPAVRKQKRCVKLAETAEKHQLCKK